MIVYMKKGRWVARYGKLYALGDTRVDALLIMYELIGGNNDRLSSCS